MQTLAPWGLVVVVVGVEKAREVEVLMLEELEHWAADKDNGQVGKHCGKWEVGKKEEVYCILDTCYLEGERCWRCWPLLEGSHSPFEVERMHVKELQQYH